ncbi:hypothetical protein MTsPCn5_32500 [Croceitalea sp. MTPC5]|uniref:methionyl-tRNA formyltransferase n=1 Tax=Croceitalea sp. MTPC5 TaxID=3056565 RepID=UPI002B38779F|nr:hypothetical protein MTsPCn5_32500 [Croceitalea sp. MTPC5]
MQIGLLASGRLGLIVLEDLFQEYDLTFVMTDKKSDDIIGFCQKRGLDFFIGNPRDGRSNAFISNRGIDVLISVNYLFLIEEELIRHPKKFCFNLHGSLLPKYRGRTPHVWAIINGELQTGITAHLIDKGCDTGNILKQVSIAIGKKDTGAAILDKFAEIYPKLVREVLLQIKSNQLKPIAQDIRKATYFGKRTPQDGEINWMWSKERIYNWIRAQAPPYPGAFTFANHEKIIIKSSSFSTQGFDYKTKDGTVLSLEPFLVKTCNGVLELDLLNPQDRAKLKINTLLGN